MKKLTLALLAFVVTNVFAQQDTLKYRISLTDKSATTYSLKRPQEFLSQKAIDRRTRQGIAIDSTDLPVCKKYIDAIKAKGVSIVAIGKWENFVTVSCNDSTAIERIAQLPFVSSTQKVWIGSTFAEKEIKRDSLMTDTTHHDNWYGAAYRQIQMSNGDKLHQAGFKGEGMTIGVIDAGFHNADIMPAMDNIKILGTKDFVHPGYTVFDGNSHGMCVMACMAMNKPHVMVGTAPEASYWLIRSEDERSEYMVEEDYASVAFEFADSVGVDVINTSLGYYTFDDKSTSYKLRDLDGKKALMSRQAARIADKGMILVCSAGNCGSNSWKKITTPGDADNILTVGAIAKNKELAPFSSIGNTVDGRVKPDVVAVGMFSDTMGTNGKPTMANGTSFVSPIMCGMVTCLWQACPQLTAKEVIELVRKSGDRTDFPDNIYGYGIPDMWKAYQSVAGSN